MRGLSLFSGIGGIDLGLKMALGEEYHTTVYVEIDPYCQRILEARISDGSLDRGAIWDDITTFDGRSWRGSIDLISGGFPCQDISVAGKGAGILAGKRSGLWREYARLIGEIRPRYVFIENVAALLHRGLNIVFSDLAEVGYDAEWGSFRASDVGAPQRRERIFILAYAQRDASIKRSGLSGIGRWKNDTEQVGMGSGSVANALGHGFNDERRSTAERCTRQSFEKIRRIQQRLEDPNVTRLEGGRQFQRGPTSGAVADSSSQREHTLRDVQPESDSGWTSDGSRDEDRTLGDSTRTRLERSERSEYEGHRDGPAADDLGVFPPGPSDRDAWRDIIERYPDLSPAIEKTTEPYVRRMVAGVPVWVDPTGTYRVNRLKALGNAVVLQCAALAFTTLMARIS